MERGETRKRLQENGSMAMNAEHTTDIPDETDEEGPEIDKGQTIKIRLRGAKVKAKRTGNNDGLADKETERVGTDIESVAWGGETVPSFTQSTPLSETDDVNLIPSQMGEMQQIPTTDAPSMVSEDVKDVKEETEEYTAAVLRDPVRVRRHDYMARDIAAFLLNYPSRVDDPESTANVRFYNNEIRFRPYGLLIDAFHTRAFGHFKILEQHHGYPLLRYSAYLKVHPMAFSDSRTRLKSPCIPSSDS
jgi:Opioid growth factor receptor (OGFr) conserved region